MSRLSNLHYKLQLIEFKLDDWMDSHRSLLIGLASGHRGAGKISWQGAVIHKGRGGATIAAGGGPPFSNVSVFTVLTHSIVVGVNFYSFWTIRKWVACLRSKIETIQWHGGRRFKKMAID